MVGSLLAVAALVPLAVDGGCRGDLCWLGPVVVGGTLGGLASIHLAIGLPLLGVGKDKKRKVRF